MEGQRNPEINGRPKWNGRKGGRKERVDDDNDKDSGVKALNQSCPFFLSTRLIIRRSKFVKLTHAPR